MEEQTKECLVEQIAGHLERRQNAMKLLGSIDSIKSRLTAYIDTTSGAEELVGRMLRTLPSPEAQIIT